MTQQSQKALICAMMSTTATLLWLAHGVGYAQQTSPSVYWTDAQFISASLEAQQATIRVAALPRLETHYKELTVYVPEIGRGRDAGVEANIQAWVISNVERWNPGIEFLERREQTLVFRPDWKLTGSFRNKNDDYSIHVITSNDSDSGTRQYEIPVSKVETLWNCGNEQKTVVLKSSQSTQDVNRSQVTRENEVTGLLKVTLEGNLGATKVAAEFQKTLRQKFTLVTERTTTEALANNRDYELVIPKWTSTEIGLTSSSFVQTYRVTGTAVLDSEIVMALNYPAIRPDASHLRAIDIGRWSDYVPDADRTIPLSATVSIITKTVQKSLDAPTTYGDGSKCNAARKANEMALGAVQHDVQGLSNGSISMDSPSAHVLSALPNTFRTLSSKMATIQAVTEANCEATVTSNAVLQGDEIRVKHQVSINACAVPNAQSTGRFLYGIKVRDRNGRGETFVGFESRWKNRAETSFTIDETESLRSGFITDVDAIVDYNVTNCRCFK